MGRAPTRWKDFLMSDPTTWYSGISQTSHMFILQMILIPVTKIEDFVLLEFLFHMIVRTWKQNSGV